jgi:hypothetical protein
MIHSLRPAEPESGLFDVRRRQSLRRASGGAPQERSSTDQGHERAPSQEQRGSDSGDAAKSSGSHSRSDRGSHVSGDAASGAERTDMGPPGSSTEEVSFLLS